MKMKRVFAPSQRKHFPDNSVCHIVMCAWIVQSFVSLVSCPVHAAPKLGQALSPRCQHDASLPAQIVCKRNLTINFSSAGPLKSRTRHVPVALRPPRANILHQRKGRASERVRQPASRGRTGLQHCCGRGAVGVACLARVHVQHAVHAACCMHASPKTCSCQQFDNERHLCRHTILDCARYRCRCWKGRSIARFARCRCHGRRSGQVCNACDLAGNGALLDGMYDHKSRAGALAQFATHACAEPELK